MRQTLRIGLTVLALITTVTRPASAQQVTVVDLGALNNTDNSSQAFGINNTGTAVGLSTIPVGQPLGSAVHAVTFSGGVVTDLNIPPLSYISPTYSSYTATGINDSGVVIGNGVNNKSFGLPGANTSQAFVDDHGVVTQIPNANGNSQVAGINSSGVVVGSIYSFTNTNNQVPLNTGVSSVFVYNHGTLTSPIANGPSIAGGINDSGEIIGAIGFTSGGLNGLYSPMIFQNGTVTALHASFPTFGVNTQGIANGVNNLGQVVGQASGLSLAHQFDFHAFLYNKGGPLIDLGTLGGTQSNALSINDLGWVVGTSSLAGNAGQDPFLYRNGTMVDLNTLLPAGSPFVSLVSVSAINDEGQIVGTGMTADGHVHGLIINLIAVPEPSPVALAAVAGGVLGASTWLRRLRSPRTA